MSGRLSQRITRLERLANMPDTDALLDRAQLLEALECKGVKVGAATLAYWIGRGVVPRGQYGRRNNTTKSLFPQSTIALVALVRKLRQFGYRLEYIAEQVKNPDTIAALESGELSVYPNICPCCGQPIKIESLPSI